MFPHKTKARDDFAAPYSMDCSPYPALKSVPCNDSNAIALIDGVRRGNHDSAKAKSCGIKLNPAE
jgi:hypothetical protein